MIVTVPEHLLAEARARAASLDDSEIKRTIASFRAQGRHVLFPEARILADVFTSAIPRILVKSQSRNVHVWAIAHRPGKAYLSSFCHFGSGENLDVVPAPGVAEVIGLHSILSDGYSLYFEIVTHEDGTAVVYVKTDQIIASRVVAVVHASSVPGCESRLPRRTGGRRQRRWNDSQRRSAPG